MTAQEGNRQHSVNSNDSQQQESERPYHGQRGALDDDCLLGPLGNLHLSSVPRSSPAASLTTSHNVTYYENAEDAPRNYSLHSASSRHRSSSQSEQLLRLEHARRSKESTARTVGGSLGIDLVDTLSNNQETTPANRQSILSASSAITERGAGAQGARAPPAPSKAADDQAKRRRIREKPVKNNTTDTPDDFQSKVATFAVARRMPDELFACFWAKHNPDANKQCHQRDGWTRERNVRREHAEEHLRDTCEGRKLLLVLKSLQECMGEEMSDLKGRAREVAIWREAFITIFPEYREYKHHLKPFVGPKVLDESLTRQFRLAQGRQGQGNSSYNYHLTGPSTANFAGVSDATTTQVRPGSFEPLGSSTPHDSMRRLADIVSNPESIQASDVLANVAARTDASHLNGVASDEVERASIPQDERLCIQHCQQSYSTSLRPLEEERDANGAYSSLLVSTSTSSRSPNRVRSSTTPEVPMRYGDPDLRTQVLRNTVPRPKEVVRGSCTAETFTPPAIHFSRGTHPDLKSPRFLGGQRDNESNICAQSELEVDVPNTGHSSLRMCVTPDLIPTSQGSPCTPSDDQETYGDLLDYNTHPPIPDLAQNPDFDISPLMKSSDETFSYLRFLDGPDELISNGGFDRVEY